MHAAEQVIFHLTYVEAKAPGRIPNMGVTLLGPTLMAFGSEAQQQRFVPKILSGDELWCQGYSEPDAGSDLSNVKTRADLVDGQWVVNGQKVWTSRPSSPTGSSSSPAPRRAPNAMPGSAISSCR